MARRGLFAGKNCLVLGAAHPVGAAMCRRLAAQGGFVVAADRDEDGLQALARQQPSGIAPLALDMTRARALTRLSEHWAGEPLHLLVMAQPLHDWLPLSDALTSSAVATRSLAAILVAAGGAAVLLYPAASGIAGTSSRSGAVAMATLVDELAVEGARINALALHPPALRPGMAERVCTTALMMSLPMAAAVSGAVLPVGRAGQAAPR